MLYLSLCTEMNAQRLTPAQTSMKKLLSLLAVVLATLALPGWAHTPLMSTVSDSALTKSVVRAEIASNVYELVYSAKEKAVYVAAPDMTEDEDARGPSRLLRLHPETLAVQSEIELPHRGFGLALDDKAGRVYVGHGFDGAVSVVDIAKEQVIATINLVPKIEGSSARRPYAHSLRQLLVDPSRHRLYLPALANGGKPDSLLFVVDTQTLTLEKTLPGLGFESTGIAMDTSGQRLFISNLQAQLITVDAQSLTLTKTAEIDADQPINIAYDPDGQRVFATDQGIGFRTEWREKGLGHAMPPRSDGHQLVVLDAASGESLARFPTDQHPLSVLFDAKHKRLYVTNFNGIRVDNGKGTLAVYDSDTYALQHVLPLPPHPSSLARDPDNNILYVSVKNDGESSKAGRLEGVARIDLGAL